MSLPTLDDIRRLAEEALAQMPDVFKPYIADVAIRVQDFPDEETMADMDLETPFDLLGLYRGVSRPERLSGDSGRLPDLVFLYRRPLLDHAHVSGEELAHLVRNVLIHEIGHHFGFSDEDMEAIEDAAP
jgi:predicted Zn-dependent protease with MMP-like domain